MCFLNYAESDRRATTNSWTKSRSRYLQRKHLHFKLDVSVYLTIFSSTRVEVISPPQRMHPMCGGKKPRVSCVAYLPPQDLPPHEIWAPSAIGLDPRRTILERKGGGRLLNSCGAGRISVRKKAWTTGTGSLKNETTSTGRARGATGYGVYILQVCTWAKNLARGSLAAPSASSLACAGRGKTCIGHLFPWPKMRRRINTRYPRNVHFI